MTPAAPPRQAPARHAPPRPATPRRAYANPARFLALAATLTPWLAAATGALFAAGLYAALLAAPADYRQGEAVRIMFVHVPAAWMALAGYSFMAAAHGVGFIWRLPLAAIAARACAPIGACFAFLTLATGALWGKPMWGTWWVWDARLTSVLILFLLYMGYIALWQAHDAPSRAARTAGILAIAGFINVPIIHFSVQWWHTLHQPASVLRLGAPALHSSILIPLLIMAAAYAALFATLLLVRMRAHILWQRTRSLQIAHAGP